MLAALVTAIFSLVVTALSTSSAFGQLSPADRCQIGKNDAAARYEVCRQRTEARFVRTGNAADRDRAFLKCGSRFAKAWQALEAQAAATGATCPDEPLDRAAVQDAIAQCTDRIATALDGGGLADCGNGVVEVGEECDQSDLAGKTCVSQGFVAGSLGCGADCSFDTSDCAGERFVDAGDGTVIDHVTGLQWEKKTGAGGGYLNCAVDPCTDPHDASNRYAWSSVPAGQLPDGPLFTKFFAALNDCYYDPLDARPPAAVFGGFAGHCDWRLPTIVELQTIVKSSCGLDSCIDPVLGNTTVGAYRSSTLAGPTHDLVWYLFSYRGETSPADIEGMKWWPDFVIAVRRTDP